MIYDIVISDQAEIDLRGIFEYIAFELQVPENASGQLDRLEACIMDLDHMPKRYRQYELEPWKSRGLRVAPVGNYLVLYIPDDDTQVVTIIRVMYGGRDVDTQLNRFTKTK
ncbi:type II toxin-antitoxin system RelE/ParE family toxin [Eshraghiella crossota]|uniref:type II toxin-antitoxin system RelE/ParE family toxin n=1 Tax=Eshraghiella crossota TaxID=45851 RepID=UPI004028EE0E